MFDELTQRFITWASARDDLRAAIIVGSQARTDRPADRWSDLDLIMLSTEPERYLNETDWLETIGTPVLSFLEGTAIDRGQERRVLFEGGADVDFIPIAVEEVRQMAEQGWPADVASVFSRGFKVILDKDGLERLFTFDDTAARPKTQLPSEAVFLNFCHDFLYHAVWTAKKLARGELWTAKLCLDGAMKWQLLTLLEWQAKARHGPDYDTWHNGRFLERWADPEYLAGLGGAYAYYDDIDLRRALNETITLGGRLGRDTAALLTYTYPEAAEAKVQALINSYL